MADCRNTPHSEEAKRKRGLAISRSFAIRHNQDPNRLYHKKGWLEEEHITKGRSVAEMAEECGVSSRTLYIWFKKFNIATKGRERMKNNPAWIESMAAAQRGRNHSEEAKKKMRVAKLGKTLPKELYKSRSLAFLGDKNPNWQGGKKGWLDILRGRATYAEWRIKVFERDDYTCQECGQRGGDLEAHHKKLRIVYPELMCEVSNGQTLCQRCHRSVDHQVLQKQQMVVKLTLLDCVYLDWRVGGVFANKAGVLEYACAGRENAVFSK